MSEWSSTVTQIQQFLTQHMPHEVSDKAGVGAVAALLAGIFLCVLGAKLARIVLTVGWAGLGGLVGYKVALEAGLPPILGVLLFAAGIGAIGHLTYRLWVGLVTAGVITGLVLGAFAYHRVGPRLAEYNQVYAPLTATNDGIVETEFSVPTPAEQSEYRQGQLRREIGDFWGYVKTQDARIAGHVRALAATALVFGLLVGLATIRLTLILSTSLLGTLLVGSGVIGAINAMNPGFAAHAMHKPIISAVALGACLLISIILQARLTRQASDAPEPAPARGKAS